MKKKTTFEEIVEFMLVPLAGLGFITFVGSIAALIALLLSVFIGGG